MTDDRLSVVTPVGYSRSTCGYCSPPGSGHRSATKSSKSYGIWANQITPVTYQELLDRGWRRSGHYIYRPDNGYSGTCCPQHAIRLHAASFRPSKSHKAALNSLKQAVRQDPSQPHSHQPLRSASHKGKYSKPWDVEHEWAQVEWPAEDETTSSLDLGSQESKATPKGFHINRLNFAREERRRKRAELENGKKNDCWWTDLDSITCSKRRRLQTSLAPATSTVEKYQLFRMYQMKIHGEPEEKVSSRQGFERFLCKSPVMLTSPTEHDSEEVQETVGPADPSSPHSIPYGLYHMEYRLDDVLIAVGVLDILPRCLTSVYLFYHPEYASLELGKVSVLREIALVKQISRKEGMGDVQYYNLGLYIHCCSKMRYKAQFQPAELLDSMTCQWTLYQQAQPYLDKGVRYGYSNGVECLSHLLAITHTRGMESNDPCQNGSSDRLHSERKDDREGEKMLYEADKAENEDDEDKDEDEEEDDDNLLPDPPPPGITSPKSLSNISLAQTLILDLEGKRVKPLLQSSIMGDQTKLPCVVDCVAALNEVIYRFILYY